MYDVCNDWICVRDEGEMTHDCVTLTYAATSEIAETPIENAELELFVDGSAQVIEGNRRAEYAVTSTTEVVASGRLTAAAVLCQGRKLGLMCHTVKLFLPLQG